MLTFWNTVVENCNYVFYELCDARTRDDWPSAGTLATILLSYLYFCKVAGPAWMKNRKPFDLTKVIFYYNIFQIIMSTYTFVGGTLIFSKYNLICQPVSYAQIPRIESANYFIWIYLVLKLIELLDTIFFVLRKKTRQISNLHLYHHFMMPICTFLGAKYFPNGHSTSLGVINSFVHMVMYTYYLIAGLGPQYQKLLWWKKHVTILQLVQFVIIFIHNLLPLVYGCDYPKWINVSLCIGAIHFVYMFGKFYYTNYIRPSKTINNGQQKVN